MEKLILISVIAASALALAGCNGFQDAHGGGGVALQSVVLIGRPGPANFALSLVCNDNQDAYIANFEWSDATNGIHFHARQAWTPVPAGYTCDQLPAYADTYGIAQTMVTVDDEGQPVGQAIVRLTQPGMPLPGSALPVPPPVCRPSECSVSVQVAYGNPNQYGYAATGCLDQASISFQ